MKRDFPQQTTLRDAGLRLREFLRIEREGMMHPSIRALSVRPAVLSDSDTALSQFLRIERGIEA